MRLNLVVKELKTNKNGKGTYAVQDFSTTYPTVDEDRIMQIVRQELRGAGSDSRVTVEIKRSTPRKAKEGT